MYKALRCLICWYYVWLLVNMLYYVQCVNMLFYDYHMHVVCKNVCMFIYWRQGCQIIFWRWWFSMFFTSRHQSFNIETYNIHKGVTNYKMLLAIDWKVVFLIIRTFALSTSPLKCLFYSPVKWICNMIWQPCIK